MAALTALQTYPGAQNSEDSLAAPFRYDPMSGPSRWSQKIDLRDSLSLTDTTPSRKDFSAEGAADRPWLQSPRDTWPRGTGRKSPSCVPVMGGWPPIRSRMDPRTLGDRGPILNRNHNPWAADE